MTRTHSRSFSSVVDLWISVFKVPEGVRSHILLIFEDCIDDDGGGRAGLAEPLLPANDDGESILSKETNMPMIRTKKPA